MKKQTDSQDFSVDAFQSMPESQRFLWMSKLPAKHIMALCQSKVFKTTCNNRNFWIQLWQARFPNVSHPFGNSENLDYIRRQFLSYIHERARFVNLDENLEKMEEKIACDQCGSYDKDERRPFDDYWVCSQCGQDYMRNKRMVKNWQHPLNDPNFMSRQKLDGLLPGDIIVGSPCLWYVDIDERNRTNVTPMFRILPIHAAERIFRLFQINPQTNPFKFWHDPNLRIRLRRCLLSSDFEKVKDLPLDKEELVYHLSNGLLNFFEYQKARKFVIFKQIDSTIFDKFLSDSENAYFSLFRTLQTYVFDKLPLEFMLIDNDSTESLDVLFMILPLMTQQQVGQTVYSCLFNNGYNDLRYEDIQHVVDAWFRQNPYYYSTWSWYQFLYRLRISVEDRLAEWDNTDMLTIDRSGLFVDSLSALFSTFLYQRRNLSRWLAPFLSNVLYPHLEEMEQLQTFHQEISYEELLNEMYPYVPYNQKTYYAMSNILSKVNLPRNTTVKEAQEFFSNVLKYTTPVKMQRVQDFFTKLDFRYPAFMTVTCFENLLFVKHVLGMKDLREPLTASPYNYRFRLPQWDSILVDEFNKTVSNIFRFV